MAGISIGCHAGISGGGLKTIREDSWKEKFRREKVGNGDDGW